MEYGLVINAVDQAGNVEPQEPAEAITLVDHDGPLVFVQPLPPFSKGPLTLQIGGGDLPNGPGQVNAGIAWYDVFYRVNGGAWSTLALATTATTVALDNLIDGATYDFQARAFDKAENEQPLVPTTVQATTAIDRRAPVVTFAPVPGIDNPRFTVRWSGVDPAPGASGVARYDIQLSVNNGPWSDWATATTETARVFDGAFSNVYAFRGRAVDNVGNQGAYPREGQLYVGVLDRATPPTT
ncbi:MAG: hypothetical protein U0470_12860 [Anaerolineae bacterium]